MKISGIKYIGPCFDNSGYAKACRNDILALLVNNIPVTISPISFENSNPDLGEVGKILKPLVNKKIDYNIVMVRTTPEFWERFKEPGKVMINHTIWETTKLHPDWVPYINNNAHKLLVATQWNAEVFRDSGVTIPIGVVPHCLDKDYSNKVKPFPIAGLSDETYVFGFVGQWCYDKETRVLTKEGFKYFKDITYDDQLATMNLETEELEYHKPEKIVSFDRKDKMLHLEGSLFDICVTPDHKMVVKDITNDNGWELKPFNELLSTNRSGDLIVKNKFRAKKSCKWYGKEKATFCLPYEKNLNTTPKNFNPEINMDSFLEFLGWYLSEGSTYKGTSGYVTTITQLKNKVYIEEICSCIEKMGFTPFISGKDIRFNSKDMYNYLVQFGKCYEKYIPSFVKDLSSRQIIILLTSLFKGDGTLNKEDGRWVKYTTTSKRLAEDIQECLLKIGLSGAISSKDPSLKKLGKIDDRFIKGVRTQYTVSINRSFNEPSMHYANLLEIDYDGKVYCATVKNHNMFIERGGKVLFSGNTERKDPLSLLKAYWYAFQNKENVALVLKTYRSSYAEQEKNIIRATIKQLKNSMVFDEFPKTLLLPDMLTEEEINSLYTRMDCYVSLDRGEGWGLGPFQAGASGKPVIATGFGGVTEFLKEDNSYLVNYTLAPTHGMPYSPWYKSEQLWAQADIYHGASLMQEVFNNRQAAKDKGNKLQKYIQDKFSLEVVGKIMVDEIKELL